MDHQIIVQVPVKLFAERYHTFRDIPRGWTMAAKWSDPITVQEVYACKEVRTELIHSNRQHHVERIAYFVREGWDRPISVRVVLEDQRWELVDGYHRLHAAVIRGDEFIEANLYTLCRWTLKPPDRMWIEAELQVKSSQ